MTIDKLISSYEAALKESDYDAIGRIISLLNRESTDFKKKALSLYQRIDDDLFQRSRSLGNYDLQKYIESISEPVNKSVGALRKQETVKANTNPAITFDEYFRTFFERHKEIFQRLKDYYFYKIEVANSVEKPGVLILCDEDSEHRPEWDKLQNAEAVLKISKEVINDSIEKYRKDVNLLTSNYICILCVTPSLKEDDNFKNNLRDLFNLFDPAYTIAIQTNASGSMVDYSLESFKDESFEKLTDSTNKIFNNAKLTYEEQKIIKLFFGGAPTVIDYKVLKPGASGSSVMEVQGNFTRTKDSKRYVIKIARKEKGQPSKLKIELKNFEDCVDHFSTGYSAKYGDTETLEAIRYNYASTDSISDSLSFNEIIDATVNGTSNEGINVNTVINSLFNCEIIKAWNKPREAEKKVEQLYKSYIKNEAKVIRAIQEIKNIGSKEVNHEPLLNYYNKLKDYRLKTFEKICHGDLHSENFFWDGTKVYLIDFGFTNMHHAVIDHAIFEASLRLKHFPLYIEMDELLSYEEKFLDSKSFEENFDLSFVKRNNLKSLYGLINQVRIDSKQYLFDKNSVGEYLISLFFVLFRQIQYKDLNQRFAINLSELVGKQAVQFIDSKALQGSHVRD
jgi:hypothetical protein